MVFYYFGVEIQDITKNKLEIIYLERMENFPKN